MPLRLGAGHTALVTGASSGIGLEIARQLAKDGVSLVLVARSEGALLDLAAELQAAHGVQVTVLAADLAAPGGAASVKDAVDAAGIEVDALVNNAGFGVHEGFLDRPLATQLAMVDLNVKAYLAMAHLFTPGMVARGWGRVLNVSSIAGFQPAPYFAVYSATKAFISSWSKALAYELRLTGVRVTNFAPGVVRTGFTEAAGMEGSPLFARLMPHWDAAKCGRAAVRAMRRGRPQQIGGWLNWLMVRANHLVPPVVGMPIAAALITGRPHLLKP